MLKHDVFVRVAPLIRQGIGNCTLGQKVSTSLTLLLLRMLIERSNMS